MKLKEVIDLKNQKNVYLEFFLTSKPVNYLFSLPSSDSPFEIKTIFKFILFLLIMLDTFNNRELISFESLMILFVLGISHILISILLISRSSCEHSFLTRARVTQASSQQTMLAIDCGSQYSSEKRMDFFFQDKNIWSGVGKLV